jgi:Bor protein
MSARSPFVALSLVLAAGVTAGCAATTVRSGLPPGEAAPGYDDRWHPAFLFGVIPGRDPYDLARICPNGWAQVTVTRDPFTLLSGLVTLFIYSPSRVTIVCGVPGSSDLPPFAGYAPAGKTSTAPRMPPAPEDD